MGCKGKVPEGKAKVDMIQGELSEAKFVGSTEEELADKKVQEIKIKAKSAQSTGKKQMNDLHQNIADIAAQVKAVEKQVKVLVDMH